MLHLLSQCAFGQFDLGAQEVSKVIDYDTVYLGMVDPELPDKLRAEFCQLMLHCYVNKPGVHAVVMPQYVRKLDNLQCDNLKPISVHERIKVGDALMNHS